jgi:hypothetical protein
MPWRWRRYVPPKRPLTFNGLHGVISQNVVLFITTAVRTCIPTLHEFVCMLIYCDLWVVRPWTHALGRIPSKDYNASLFQDTRRLTTAIAQLILMIVINVTLLWVHSFLLRTSYRTQIYYEASSIILTHRHYSDVFKCCGNVVGCAANPHSKSLFLIMSKKKVELSLLTGRGGP